MLVTFLFSTNCNSSLSILVIVGNSECGVTDREPERLVADFDASRDVLILNIVYRVELVADNCVVL